MAINHNLGASLAKGEGLFILKISIFFKIYTIEPLKGLFLSANFEGERKGFKEVKLSKLVTKA